MEKEHLKRSQSLAPSTMFPVLHCRPFFLYFAPDNTHIPLFTSPQFAGVSRRGLYGDCVEELDWGVGQILETIRSLAIRRCFYLWGALSMQTTQSVSCKYRAGTTLYACINKLGVVFFLQITFKSAISFYPILPCVESSASVESFTFL